MNYTIYTPGIGQDAGFSSQYQIKNDAFNVTIAIAEAMYNYWGNTTPQVLIVQNETGLWGIYNAANNSWFGDLRP